MTDKLMEAAAAEAGYIDTADYVRSYDYGREDLGSAAVVAAGTFNTITPLSLNSYQASTADTAIYPGKGTPLGLIYCGLKLAGEAGEVAEKIGKAIRDDGMEPWASRVDVVEWDNLTPERREAIKGELGDVLWYVASAARELGYDLGDIAQANLDKLASRKSRGTLQGSGDNR